MNFPNGFKEKYQHLLGEDAAAFFATFDQEAVAAFRTNPLKEAQKVFEAKHQKIFDMMKKTSK